MFASCPVKPAWRPHWSMPKFTLFR